MTDFFVVSIAYINIVLYATCFQLQRPIEPFMVEKLGLGDGSEDYARLQSFFSIMQMVGSLMFGILLDRLGSKGGFIVSFAASAMCYGLLANATSIEMLYISKIPTIFQAGFLCAQAAISEATSDGPDRLASLGRLTVAYTVGSIIGPSIGGALGATGDYYLGARLAVYGSILSIILCLFLPNKQKIDKISSKEDTPIQVKEVSPASLKDTLVVFKQVWLLLSSKVISSIANSMASAAMPLILKNGFHLQEGGMGISMSVLSAFNAFTNAFLLAPLVSLCGGDTIYTISFVLTSMMTLYLGQFCLLSVNQNFYFYMGTTILLSMLQYVLSTTITGESTSRVEKDHRGTLLGMEHSLFAAARIFSPQLGVFFLTAGGITAVSGACGAVYCVVFGVWSIYSGQFRAGRSGIEEKKGY